jgi:hypothetical protein
MDHLLIHCEIASALWNAIFNSVGLTWVMPSQVVNPSLLIGKCKVVGLRLMCMEDDTILPYLVSLEGKKRWEL